MIKLSVNGKPIEIGDDVADDTPVLWVLREHLGLTGTKYGCGISECGLCTVLMDGEPVLSCTTELAEAEDTEITTIEGLSNDGSHPVQKAWKEHAVPQCGYCQVGQMMLAAAMLESNDNPSDDEIDEGVWAICRCGTYPRIRKAVKSAAKEMRGE